jgi:hypothetical protein
MDFSQDSGAQSDYGGLHVAGSVAMFLVIVAALIDGVLLLPTFEAGGGSHGVAVASWLVVNLTPAIVGTLLWRREGHKWPGALGRALLVALLTGIAIIFALVAYMATGDWN